MMPEPLERFLRIVLEDMVNAGVDFCVVRWNPQEWIPGRDIDILLNPASRKLAGEVIRGSAKREGGVIINTNAYRGREHIMMAVPHPAERPCFVELDLQLEVIEADRRIAWAVDVLSGKSVESGIPVPEPGVAVALSFLRALLRRRAFTEDHWKSARGAAATGGDFERRLGELIGEGMAKTLVAAVRDDDIARLLGLRDAVLTSECLGRGGARIRERHSWGFRVRRKLNGVMWPRGTLVSFAGPDGAGKTTIASSLAEVLQPAPYPVRYLYCGKQSGSPDAAPSKVKRGLATKVREVARRTLSPSTGFRRVIWLTAALVRQLPREWRIYFKDIRPILAKGGVAIVDRYYIDHFANVWSEIPAAMRTALIRCMPTPDLTVHLVNAPEVVFARKAERSIEEIAACTERLRALGQVQPNWQEFRTDVPPRESAWTILIRVMEARQRVVDPSLTSR